MELRATEKIRRNEQLNRTLGHRAEGSGRERAQAAPKEPADQLTLSRQALDFAQERSREMWEAQSRQGRQGRLAGMLEALETEKKKLDGMDEKLKTMNKCQKIAAAIMRGDRVPPEDLRYLIEHDQEGYKLALAMRRPKKDPEDVESVLDEEDRNGGKTEEADGGGEAPSVEAAGASEGGGETSNAAE